MKKTPAQRQAEYRARHLKDETGTGARLNMLVDVHAKLSLERLAACYGVTQRAMLERIIRDAERVALEELRRAGGDGTGYYDKTVRL